MRTEALPSLKKFIGTDGPQTCVGRFRDPAGQRYELYTDCSSPALVFRVPGRLPLAITPGDPEALLPPLKVGGAGTFHLPVQRISPETWMSTLPLLILAALALWPWPRLGYRLAPDALEVRRRLGVDRLFYSGLQLRPARNRLGLRLVGPGLPGYHTGLHATAGGRVMAAATSSHAPALLLASGSTTSYLTPADPQALMNELARRGATLLNE